MRLIEIAAVGKDKELGKDNDLVWHFSEDMKFFRRQTKGHSVVMGRKTFESLPSMLPGRHHIVISRSKPQLPEEVEVFETLHAFLEAYKDKDEDIYVIGGREIYHQLLPYAKILYLTEINATCQADVFFPDFDASLYHRTVLGKESEDGIDYQFVKYEKM